MHFLLSGLSERKRAGEVMDEPSLDPAEHVRALGGLERINGWTKSAGIVWPPIQALAKETGRKPLRLLDLATGGGDIPIQLWQRARREGLLLEIEGCDKSSTAVDYARRRAEERGAGVRFYVHDVLAQGIPSGYDIIVGSLFLHHLENEEAVRLFKMRSEAAGEMVLINDLIRSAPALLFTYAGTRLVSSSKVVRVDGPRSVRAAFTIGEIHTMLQRAGLHEARVVPRRPFRFLVTWRKSNRSAEC